MTVAYVQNSLEFFFLIYAQKLFNEIVLLYYTLKFYLN